MITKKSNSVEAYFLVEFTHSKKTGYVVCGIVGDLFQMPHVEAKIEELFKTYRSLARIDLYKFTDTAHYLVTYKRKAAPSVADR